MVRKPAKNNASTAAVDRIYQSKPFAFDEERLEQFV
jgi:hypothetical protein